MFHGARSQGSFEMYHAARFPNGNQVVGRAGARAGAKPDSLISGNRLCGPHLTGIVRTWLVWELSLVSHDIHGLRPPRGQHRATRHPASYLIWGDLNISEKEIHVYFILVFVEDETRRWWCCHRRVAGRRGTPLQKDHRRVDLWNSTLPPLSPGIEEEASRKFPLGTRGHCERQSPRTLTKFQFDRHNVQRMSVPANVDTTRGRIIIDVSKILVNMVTYQFYYCTFYVYFCDNFKYISMLNVK